jgi:hypothetical protein
MNDGLSRLLPDDPENLLSVEARKRIQRALVAAERFIWEAEHLIEKRKLETFSERAEAVRKEARFKNARTALSAHHKEFSRLIIPVQKFRQIMREEIDSAANSFQLSSVERRLLENEFFYPEEQPKQSKYASQLVALPEPKSESIGKQINRLREECHLTEEELAEKIEMDIRSVQRHLANETTSYARHLRVYERMFSNLLRRQVVIRQMP